MPTQPALPSRAVQSYNRRRAGNACLVCRARKTKCDNQRPRCGFCTATGGHCQYVETDQSQFDRASLAILQRLSEVESNLINRLDSVLGNTGILGQAGAPGPNSRTSPIENFDYEVSHNAARTPGSNTTVTTTHHSATESHDSQVELFVQHSNAAENMPPSSTVLFEIGTSYFDSVHSLLIFQETLPHLKAELCVPTMEIFGQSDHHGNQTKIGTTILDLDSDVVMRLVENFLSNNHIKNPILDVDSLRRDARAFAESGPQWDGTSCLILLVCAVSTLSRPLSEELEPGPSKNTEQLAMAEAYFQASQRRIGMLYHQNTLLAAQCSFLTGAYLMATFQILAAWKCLVQASTQCLGWLKSRGRLKQAASDSTRHVDDSLYWSCLKSEIELRFLLGLPGSGINEIDYPHIFPSPPMDPVVDTLLQQPSQSLEIYGASNDRRNLMLGWFFYLAEIALKRMIHNATSFLHKLETKGSDANFITKGDVLTSVTAEFDRQIQEWYATLPAEMKFPLEAHQPTGHILPFILRGHMIDIQDTIRMPVIHAILSSSSANKIEDVSPTSLQLAQQLLHQAVERIRANREGWYHRHQGTWLMIRTCSHSALHLLGTALKCKQWARNSSTDYVEMERMLLPFNWQHAVLEVMDLLEYWVDENPDVYRFSRMIKELMRVIESAGD